MKIYKGICPCKGCESRKVHCHDKCVKYNDWLATGVEEPPKEPFRGETSTKSKGEVWKMTAREELIMYLLDDTCVDTCSKCIHDGWYKNHAEKGCPHENKDGHKACLQGMTKYFEQERLKRGTFGARLKMLRMEKGFSQRELARRSGVESGNISHYEKDMQSPTALALMCLADVLECSTDYLLGRE